MQESVGVPVPTSTQWDIVDRSSPKHNIAFEQLILFAAQGEVVHNDDTKNKIIELMLENKRKKKELKGKDFRKGIYTTGIISIFEGHKIALFFTGRNHAGENLTEVLKQRASGLAPPVQMCDGSDNNNLPEDFDVIIANCNSHARRRYADLVDCFPSECRYVINIFEKVYANDAFTKAEKMSPEERLEYHKEKSKPLMDELKKWLESQFDEKKVEPNSSLGEAITYMLNRWKKLTLFLKEKGIPLDNNIAERALKKSILHRRNSLFFKTQNGANVGDIYMSLIHTCNLCGANSFEYLTVIQKHYEKVFENPELWMPWNYKKVLIENGLN